MEGHWGQNEVKEGSFIGDELSMSNELKLKDSQNWIRAKRWKSDYDL